MPDEGAPPRAPTTVSVELGARSYDILIGRGVIENAGAEIAKRLPNVRAAIVTDETVARLHLPHFAAKLAAAGIEATPIVVKPGEESKSFASLARVVDGILAARLERNDVVIAFGGGVVGDLAGFASAIVRRGMRVIQVPTTLLAQVDSSVGGKTGINTERGKNLVGAFHQPELVLADTGILDSLPPRIFNAGYAEVAKIGLIRDAEFLRLARAELAGDGRRLAGARPGGRGRRPRQGRDGRRRRARRGRPRPPQSRPHLRPRAGSRNRVLRPPAPRRRRWRSAWCSPTSSRPVPDWRRKPTLNASSAT